MATYLGHTLIQQINTFQVPPNSLALWSMGQMGLALKAADGMVVYFDLCLTDVVALKAPDTADRFARAFPPPVLPEHITNASYVFCSHEHIDHTDAFTLADVAKASPSAQFVITGWSHGVLDEAAIAPNRRTVLPALTPTSLGNLRVTAVPHAHYAVENDPIKGHRWLGFLIEWNGVTFFHGGDTIIYDGYVDLLKQLPHIDVALMAINGRDAYRDSFGITGNLLPADAVWLAQELGWDVLLGGHNDLYAWNTIAAGELPDAVRRLNPRQKCHVLQPGEFWLYLR